MVCPAGKSGYNYCNSGRCEAFCGSVEPPGPGTPAASVPTPTPTTSVPPSVTPTNTPAPAINTGNIYTKAVIIESVNNTCDQTRTAGESINNVLFGSDHTLTGPGYSQTYEQINTYYVGFTALPVPVPYVLSISGTYDGYVAVKSCQKIVNGGSTSYNNSASLSYSLNNQDSVFWDIGYVWGHPWFQVKDGNVYSATTIQSYIPPVTPRYFNLDGSGGYPGVIMQGTANGYDFAADLGSQGDASSSNTMWLVNQSFTPTDLYTLFSARFAQSTTITTYDQTGLRPAVGTIESPAVYTASSFITTNGGTTWTVASGESLVMLVNGDLTINTNISVDPGGFLAFIVNGNITVDSTIGTTYDGTTPQIQGIFISGGTFDTGTGDSAAHGKLVAEGMFILRSAKHLRFERLLRPFGARNDTRGLISL